jgi:chromate transporter
VAIVAHAGWSIARTTLRGIRQVALLIGAILAILAGVSEIAVLLAAGVIALLARVGFGAGRPAIAVGGWTLSAPGAVALAAVVATPLLILGTFLKIGAVLFGSGYVLVALLRSELVDGLGWISEAQLIDAVAVGQATPGPLFSTATFIGYVVGGPIGAAAATVGVFLPAFVAVALSIPILDRLRGDGRARAFLDGVNAAAIGLLAAVAVQLAATSLLDVVGAATSVVAFAFLARGAGTGRLMAAGAAVGIIRLLLAPA